MYVGKFRRNYRLTCQVLYINDNITAGQCLAINYKVPFHQGREKRPNKIQSRKKELIKREQK